MAKTKRNPFMKEDAMDKAADKKKGIKEGGAKDKKLDVKGFKPFMKKGKK